MLEVDAGRSERMRWRERKLCRGGGHAPGVVNTMPEATLRAVAYHGVVPADSIRAHYDDAQHVLDRLDALGVDYDDVVATLEDDGVAAFDAGWDRLGEQLGERLGMTSNR